MKHLQIVVAATAAALSLWSCTGSTNGDKPTAEDTTLGRDNTMAILWQQNSGEYRALAFQAYRLARIRLDEAVTANKKKHRRLAVVVDVDETILNNSALQGYLALNNMDYGDSIWHKWTSLAEADTVPGACSFLQYAAKRPDVEVFYVTNRKNREYAATKRNLDKYRFPLTDTAHILVSDSPDKEPRRQAISEKDTIILLCGDNLDDLSHLFYQRGVQQRMKSVDSMQELFGKKFIVLPNPMYGSWEGAMYDYKYNIGHSRIEQIRRGLIKPARLTQ